MHLRQSRYFRETLREAPLNLLSYEREIKLSITELHDSRSPHRSVLSSNQLMAIGSGGGTSKGPSGHRVFYWLEQMAHFLHISLEVALSRRGHI